MKDIMVLSDIKEDGAAIAEVLDKPVAIHYAENVPAAKEFYVRSPFDMVIADILLLEKFAGPQGFSFSNHPFQKANIDALLVVICDRKSAQKGVQAVKDGAFAYLERPIDKKDVQQLMSSANRALSRNSELDYFENSFWKTAWLDFVRSKSARMRKIFESIRSVSPTSATVLLFGDTGTGKGKTARLIHRHSRRFEKPFIEVHCGAIPETLIESELFGHEKGAFTGADRRKPGKFEMARGGTIFLDEIGTITPSAQIKLLKVLEEGMFTLVGGESPLNADVRVIAATNANLPNLVETGAFRKDLYYRLNIFPINLPPLKERLEDLPHLSYIFLNRLNIKYNKGISRLHPSILPALQKYDWPGNIRELENLLERAYILEKTHELMPHNFPLETMLSFDSKITGSDILISIAQARQQSIQVFETSYLRALMTKANGHIQTAAGMAGISTRQLSRLLNRHGLDKTDYKAKTGRFMPKERINVYKTVPGMSDHAES